MSRTNKGNASGCMDMTAYKAMQAVQRNEPDYKSQLAEQKREEALLFISNMRIYFSRCGYEIVSDIIIRDKKTGTIYSKDYRKEVKP
ncbi:MAG: hypothetical protein FWC91_14605 [Defluviitaleaceae bacterium]|nr:hypothetical protein [Defluviitaleaceae bacterium]